jgi:hypothetical protein
MTETPPKLYAGLSHVSYEGDWTCVGKVESFLMKDEDLHVEAETFYERV